MRLPPRTAAPSRALASDVADAVAQARRAARGRAPLLRRADSRHPTSSFHAHLLRHQTQSQARLGRRRAGRGRAARAALRAGLGRHGLGAHHQPRDPVRVPGARPQHRRGLRGPARPGLHRVLRGRGVRVRAPGEPALQPARAVLDHPAARRRGRLLLRRAAGGAHAQAARRLPRDRDPRLRRDHPHLPQQPLAADQHHQRPAGHHADRPVPHRRLQLRQARDVPRPRFLRARSSTTTSSSS